MDTKSWTRARGNALSHTFKTVWETNRFHRQCYIYRFCRKKTYKGDFTEIRGYVLDLYATNMEINETYYGFHRQWIRSRRLSGPWCLTYDQSIDFNYPEAPMARRFNSKMPRFPLSAISMSREILKCGPPLIIKTVQRKALSVTWHWNLCLLHDWPGD